MGSNRKVNRYCIDCGGRLIYYARLSNPKARNEDRKLVYGCDTCTKDWEKPKLLAVTRNLSDDPLVTIEVAIIQHGRKS